MKLLTLSAAVLAFVAPVGAHAATFNGVCATIASATQALCSPSTNGTYGLSATLASINDPTLSVKITGWQANQSNNAITNAFLGAYSGGFGITGVQDQLGAGNLHQIDNVNGYTDFVMLQFSAAVHLDGIGQNFYGMNGVFDSDASFAMMTGVTNTGGAAVSVANWSSTINLASYTFPASWSTPTITPDNATVAGSTTRTNGATGFSQVWLVGASVAATDRDDGYKLSQITATRATPPVPEPATWAMMIVGFGAIGATLRRRGASGSPLLA